MPSQTISPIITRKDGVEFRSRLEARWAQMFNLLSWPWEYEPIDLNGYIPDFILTFPAGQILVEVKPAMSLAELMEAVPKVAASGWNGEVLMVGAQMFDCEAWHAPAIGLLGDMEQPGDPTDPARWSCAVMFDCLMCYQHSFFSSEHGGRCRHRGCRTNGNTHIDEFNCGSLGPHEDLRRMWYEAHRRTKWKPGRD